MLATVRSWVARLREVFHSRRLADEQDEELRFHLEMETEHNRRRGLSDADAHRAAVIALGGRERYREETRDMRGIAVVQNLARDARFALRRIRRAPGFASGTVLTLGIGIGAAIGIGTMVFGVLLRDLPYPNSDALVRVSLLTPGIAAPGDEHTEASYVHFAAEGRSFSGIGAYYTNGGINVTDGDVPERVTAAMMTPSTFALLGVVPALGRSFTPDQGRVNGIIPVLISHDLWVRRYGSDSALVGRTIELNRSPRHVIGVLPPGFHFPTPAVQVWYPESVTAEGPSLTGRYLNVVARLRPGMTERQAESELNALLPRLASRFPAITPAMIAQSGARVRVQSLKAAIVAPVRAQLVLLGVMAVVIVLVASTNVVNLFLLRVQRASQEIAIAYSLGAGRLGVAQRFVVEGVVLGALSIAVALPIAAMALATKFGFRDREIPRLHEVAFGLETAGIIALAALAIGALVGLTAVTRMGAHGLADRLRGAARATQSGAWRRVQQSLVVTQIAVALALIVASALMARSFWNLRHTPMGFEPANAISFSVSLPYSGYGTYSPAAAFHAQVTDRLAAQPGVTDAVAVMMLPLTDAGGPGMTQRIEPVGGGAERSAVVSASANLATSEYFRVMGIPLRGGRTFAPGDLRSPAPGVVISETLARMLFGNEDPVGRRVRRAPASGMGPMTFQVIGVVGDVHGERIEAGPVPALYFPLLRDGDGVPGDSTRLPYVPRWVNYVVRGATLPAATTIRGIFREVDPRIPVVQIRPLQQVVDDATARARLTLLLLGVASAAALLLGVVGVYSVVTYAASGRVREFGVRLALGATPWRVASMVLNEGFVLTAAGVTAGLALALAGARVLRALLYEVSPTSAVEYAAATALLLIVTLAAMMLPALRAGRTDPAVVLRGE